MKVTYSRFCKISDEIKDNLKRIRYQMQYGDENGYDFMMAQGMAKDFEILDEQKINFYERMIDFLCKFYEFDPRNPFLIYFYKLIRNDYHFCIKNDMNIPKEISEFLILCHELIGEKACSKFDLDNFNYYEKNIQDCDFNEIED